VDIEAQRASCLKRKICFHCGYDLRSGHAVCPECGVRVPTAKDLEERRLDAYELDPHRLRDEWPSVPITPRTPAADEGVVAVYIAHNGIEADLLKQQIEARGVQCRVEERADFGARAGYRPRMRTLVMVPAADEMVGREIVNHFRRRPRSAPTVNAETPSEESAN